MVAPGGETRHVTACDDPRRQYPILVNGEARMSRASTSPPLDRHWNCRLTVRGRKSGEPRTVTIWFALGDGKVFLTGDAKEPNWVRNLRANPDGGGADRRDAAARPRARGRRSRRGRRDPPALRAPLPDGAPVAHARHRLHGLDAPS